MDADEGSAGVAGIAEVVIGVGDLDEAIAFYTGVCGLRHVRTVEGAGAKAAELDADGQRVTLVVAGKPGVRLALHCPDVSAAHRRLRRKKVTVETDGVVEASEGSWTGFRDPWGTPLMFWQPSEER